MNASELWALKIVSWKIFGSGTIEGEADAVGVEKMIIEVRIADNFEGNKLLLTPFLGLGYESARLCDSVYILHTFGFTTL